MYFSVKSFILSLKKGDVMEENRNLGLELFSNVLDGVEDGYDMDESVQSWMDDSIFSLFDKTFEYKCLFHNVPNFVVAKLWYFCLNSNELLLQTLSVTMDVPLRCNGFSLAYSLRLLNIFAVIDLLWILFCSFANINLKSRKIPVRMICITDI